MRHVGLKPESALIADKAKDIKPANNYDSPSPGVRELEGGEIHPHTTSPFKEEEFYNMLFGTLYAEIEQHCRQESCFACQGGPGHLLIQPIMRR